MILVSTLWLFSVMLENTLSVFPEVPLRHPDLKLWLALLEGNTYSLSNIEGSVMGNFMVCLFTLRWHHSVTLQGKKWTLFMESMELLCLASPFRT